MKERGIYRGPNEEDFKSDREIKRELALKGILPKIDFETEIKYPKDVNYYLSKSAKVGEQQKEMSPRAEHFVKVTLPDTSIISVLADLHFGQSTMHEERLQQELEVILNTPNSYVLLNGDLLHGIHWGGAAGTEQNTSLDEQRGFLRSLFDALEGKVILATSGEHDCVDEKTQAYTKRGWLNYDEIEEDDEFLTLNPKTEKLEWHEYEYFHKYDEVDLPMVRIKTRDFDFLGTKNHRMFIKGRRNNKYDFRSAEEFSKQDWGNELIPMASTFGRLNVCKRGGLRFNSPKKISSIENYTGVVWDITVPNENFLVRRNGKEYFTGNSKWASKSGSDPYFDFTERTGAPYVRGVAEVEINVGNKQIYKGVTQHRARGHSMYNKNHPTFREARFELQGADFYISSHTHTKQISKETIREHGGARDILHISTGPYATGGEYSERSGYPRQDPKELFGASFRLHKDEKYIDSEYSILKAHEKWV